MLHRETNRQCSAMLSVLLATTYFVELHLFSYLCDEFRPTDVASRLRERACPLLRRYSITQPLAACGEGHYRILHKQTVTKIVNLTRRRRRLERARSHYSLSQHTPTRPYPFTATMQVTASLSHKQITVIIIL